MKLAEQTEFLCLLRVNKTKQFQPGLDEVQRAHNAQFKHSIQSLWLVTLEHVHLKQQTRW